MDDTLPKPHAVSSGEVIAVVRNAISASIVKSVGGSRPLSTPMLSTTSSTSPRVFISAPSANASRHEKPCVLAIATEIRRTSEIPLLLFTYLNPALRYGFERLARDRASLSLT